MKLIAFTLVSFSVAIALAKAPTNEPKPSVERGRYLVTTSGCNDCHTPMYGPKNGAVPESDWLIGVPVGWKGPWGTTYAANLRKRAAQMDEKTWVTYLKNLRSRPPMPYFNVNAYNETDSKSIYMFIRALGDHDQKLPEALPPGKDPQTPYFNFDIVMPGSKTAAR